MLIMIARPTAASAAATVITRRTITWPSKDDKLRAMATKLKFTALSISSMHINITIAFLLITTPSTPIVNRMTLKPK
jgi:hypothetical protein